MGNDRPARPTDVHMKITEVPNSTGGSTVTLAGLVMHSAIAMQSVEVRDEGDARRVWMMIGLATPGQTGSFEVDVPVEKHVHRILFGPGDTVVWTRHANHAPSFT